MLYKVDGYDVCAEVRALVLEGIRLTTALATIAQLHNLSDSQCNIMTNAYIGRYKN